MLNRMASLAMSTGILKALPGILDIKNTHLVFSIPWSYSLVYRLVGVYTWRIFWSLVLHLFGGLPISVIQNLIMYSLAIINHYC